MLEGEVVASLRDVEFAPGETCIQLLDIEELDLEEEPRRLNLPLEKRMEEVGVIGAGGDAQVDGPWGDRLSLLFVG